MINRKIITCRHAMKSALLTVNFKLQYIFHGKMIIICMSHFIIIGRWYIIQGTFKALFNLPKALCNMVDQTISEVLPTMTVQRSDPSENTTLYFALRWGRGTQEVHWQQRTDHPLFFRCPPLTCLHTPVHRENHSACQRQSTAFTNSPKHRLL